MAQVCRRARSQPGLDEPRARVFFETNFRAEPVPGEGMLTAYFAPEYEARSTPNGEFRAPVRGKPADLVMVDGGLLDAAQRGRAVPARRIGGRIEPYPDRAAIEATNAARPLAWMRPEDLFFLQVQGSGVLAMPNGRRLKVGVAATNGRAYVALGGILRDRGYLAPDATNAAAIREWLAARRGPEADAMMRMNPRYIFFMATPDDGGAPVGAARIPLAAGHAAAVDPAAHAMGDLLWLDADRPTLAGARPTYRRMVMALDVGAAIKGPSRIDLYLGQGFAAGAEAGTVHHALRVRRLVPVGSAPP
jgi:membrane-bound lytic murein transglycosylase A